MAEAHDIGMKKVMPEANTAKRYSVDGAERLFQSTGYTTVDDSYLRQRSLPDKIVISNTIKRNVLLVCLVIAPLFQLIGDAMWVTKDFDFSWSIWREASYVFFIPAGFLLAKIIEQKSVKWAIACCAIFVIGCFGVATMMPLFRLGAYYPTVGPNEFPEIVQSVINQGLFAITIYPPGLFFPISLVLFGVAFLKLKLLNKFVGIAFIVAGVLFWLGNAGAMLSALIIGDAWLLLIFCYLGYVLYKDSSAHETAQA